MSSKKTETVSVYDIANNIGSTFGMPAGAVAVANVMVDPKSQDLTLSINLKLGKMTLKNLSLEGDDTLEAWCRCLGCSGSRATSGCPVIAE